MTRKTILTTVMVFAVIVATISASSIAYAATDPKPKDTAKSFFDIFTELGYTPNSFFDVFTDADSFFDVFIEKGYTPNSFFDVFTEVDSFFDVFTERGSSFFDVFTELQGDVDNLETQVAEIQSQIGSGGSAQSVDMFIKIDGIPGESTDDKHKDEIVIESWSWGATQSATIGSGAGGGTGKVSFQDFHFVHKVDKASPKLFLATAKGEHFPEVVLTVRKAGDKPLEYLIYKLKDVIVSGVSSSTSGDNIPSEEVTLNFAKYEIEYTPQDSTGTAGTPVKANWDIKENKGS
jgi:type VI secretion system secreted protein Hcp